MEGEGGTPLRHGVVENELRLGAGCAAIPAAATAAAGRPTATTTAAATAGTRKLEVDSPMMLGFRLGDTIEVSCGTARETHTIAFFGSLGLMQPLQHDFSQGSAISLVLPPDDGSLDTSTPSDVEQVIAFNNTLDGFGHMVSVLPPGDITSQSIDVVTGKKGKRRPRKIVGIKKAPTGPKSPPTVVIDPKAANAKQTGVSHKKVILGDMSGSMGHGMPGGGTRIEWLKRLLVEMINEFCDQGVDFAVAAWDTTTEFPSGAPIRWLGG